MMFLARCCANNEMLRNRRTTVREIITQDYSGWRGRDGAAARYLKMFLKGSNRDAKGVGLHQVLRVVHIAISGGGNDKILKTLRQ